VDKKLRWIENRVKAKANIKPEVTREVLGVIADLVWDWEKSQYDFWGLDIEETLKFLGKERCPKGRRKDLSL
jgi:hypothetical protein